MAMEFPGIPKAAISNPATMDQCRTAKKRRVSTIAAQSGPNQLRY